MQAFESANLSLAEFKRRAGFASAKSAVSRPRRDVTSALKTVFWTYGLCQMTGIATPYGLERYLEPKSFRRSADGDWLHINKWPGYAKGRHEPRRVLPAVGRACPGANDCLRSPVWAALAASTMSTHHICKLLKKLPTPLQDFVRRHGRWPEQARPDRRRNFGTLTKALERRASLDSLAVVILLLRQAHAVSDQEGAYDWAGRLWRMMVLLGPSLVDGGIARPMAELVEERIMPMATLEGVRLGFPDGNYLRVVAAFRTALARTARQSLSEHATEWQQKAVGPGLLDYKWGCDFLHAFNPIPLVSDGTDLLGLSGRAVHEARWAAENRWCHEWGLNMLSLGGHQNPPPDAARTGKDLWAADSEDPIARLIALRGKERGPA